MKIKITSNRQPWVNDKPQPEGAEIDVTDADAKALIEAGLAEAAEAKVVKKAIK